VSWLRLRRGAWCAALGEGLGDGLVPALSRHGAGAEVKYRTLVIDPPWAYSLRQEDPTHRGRCVYGTMGTEDLRTLPVKDWSDQNAHLYLWTTNAFMVEAHDLVKAWGFEQKTILTWVKDQIGLGNYYRNNTEHILFCVRGRLPVARHDAPTAFRAPRSRHSEKPAAFYDIVESMSPGPYLDVFARKLRFNWDAWGAEVGAPPGLPEPEYLALPL